MKSTWNRLFSLMLASGISVAIAPAAPLNWDTAIGDGVTLTDGTGTWGTGNWNNTGTDTSWSNGNDAVFGGGGTGTAGSVTTGTVTVNSLTFNTPFAGGYDLTGGTITMGGSSLTANANAAISSVLAGASGLSIGGIGVLTLTGSNSYAGGTTIASGSTVNVGNGGSTGSLGGGALVNNGALTYNLVGTSTVATLGAGGITGITGSGSTLITADTINFGASGGFTATTSGNQSYIATRNATTLFKGLVVGTSGSYNFTTTGGASITMNGDLGASAASTATLNLDTSSGNGTINLDISVGRSNQFWNIGAINANAGTGAINWTGTYGAIRGADSSQSTPITLTGAINMTSNFQAQTALTLTLNAAGTSTVSGNLLGTINLVKGGSQNLTISGANTYRGTTTVSVGCLIVSGASNTSGTSIASGAFVELNNTSGTVRDYTNTTNFTGAGTLVKTGTGTVQWGAGVVTFDMTSGALIDVQNGTFIGGASANDVWTNNKADLNVAAGAVFDGAEGSSLANGGIFVDALSGSGTIKIGYTAGGPFGNKITFGVDNGTGSFAGVLANSTTDGNYVKTGTGTQTLTGTSTATGSMTVNNGTLALGHATNTLANTMAVTVDGASAILSIGANSDTVGAVTLKNSAQITGSGGMLTGASYAVESGSISAILGGAVNLAKSTVGTVTLAGANTYSGSTTVSQGRLILSSTSNTNATSIASGATLELNKASGTSSVSVTTNFTGAGTLVKTGAGAVTWYGAATFNLSSGAMIDVQEGTFTAADNANDIWTNNKSDLNVAAGATFDAAEAGALAGNGVFVNKLTGSGTIKLGYTDNGLGTDYANKFTFGVDNGSASFAGVLADKRDPYGKFVKTGTGTQTLTGSSTATGSMTVNSGTLALGHATNTLANTMAVAVDGASAILSIGGNSDTVGAVTLKNGGAITGTGGTLTGAGYAVEKGSISAILGGSGIALTKTTADTVTLSGDNSYTGATNINAGTLLISGNQSAATGAVTVNNTGTVLSGTGTIGGATTINSGAIHAPGSSPGIQAFSSNLTYSSGSIFEWDLASSAQGTRGTDAGDATSYDGVNVGGTLAGDGGSGAIFRVVLGAGTFNDGFWNTSQSWSDIFQKAGVPQSLAAIFPDNKVQWYEGATDMTSLTGSRGSFTISGTSLSWTAVPEPTSALAGLLLGVGLLRRRRS